MSILKIKGVTSQQLLYMDNGFFIALCMVSIELKSLIFIGLKYDMPPS